MANAKIVPVIQLELSDAKIDGYINPGYYTWGTDWHWQTKADKSRKEPQDMWQHIGTERIDSIKAAAPKKSFSWSDMNIDDWAATLDVITNWTELKTNLTRPYTDFLYYKNATAGAASSIKSVDDYYPRVFCRFIRFVPVENETQLPYIRMFFYCNETYGYLLHIPFDVYSEAGAMGGYENFTTKVFRLTFSGDEWISEEIASSDQLSFNNSQQVFDISVENISDKYILIKSSTIKDFEWLIYTGSTYPLIKGKIGIGTRGQMIGFNLQETQWLQKVTDGEALVAPYVEPSTYYYMEDGDTIWRHSTLGNEIAGYYSLYANAVNTTISLEEIVYHVGDTVGTRPKITFNTTGYTSNYRPLVYNVAQYNPPTVLPFPTRVDSVDTTMYPEKITWKRTNEWRGADFTAEFKDFNDEVDLGVNDRCIMSVWWDREDEVEVASAHRRIRGYLDGSFRIRDGSKYFGEKVPTIKAKDGISSRLANTTCRRLGSLCAMTISEAFYALLYLGGVHADLISVTATGATTYKLGNEDPWWDIPWKFDETHGVVQAIDKIVDWVNSQNAGVEYQWGCDDTGYFLRDRPLWTGAADTDWTIHYDEDIMVIGWSDPETGEIHYKYNDNHELVKVIATSKDMENFANISMVIYNKYNSAVVWDEDSINDDTADNYYGMGAWNINDGGDTMTGAQAIYLAAKNLIKSNRYSCMIEITCENLDIEPDNFICIHADMPEFTDGSIFRVIAENGSVDGNGEVSVTYTCNLEYSA